jgi:hypothetical protein
MIGTMARQQLKVPVRLTSTTLRHSSREYSVRGFTGPVIPAPFTRPSMRPKAACVC